MAEPLERLAELGLELPEPPPALASYVPTRAVSLGDGRGLLYVSGQVPLSGGQSRWQGRVPDQVSVEEAQEAARLCALNILSQVHAAAGLDRVECVLQVTGFVLSAEGFQDQPKVVNAASDLLVEVLGEAGRHSRMAVGTNALPLSVPVEIAAVVAFRTG
jgi:enamine deaminase RidA (YjgF/YER057c/UK114 family)